MVSSRGFGAESIVALKAADHRYKVKSLGRALDLLDILGQEGEEGSLTTLSRALKLSKPATHAILKTYLARGFIRDVGEGQNRRYRLGLALAGLGDAALRDVRLLEV